jgi:hypothetical protein
VKGRDPRVTVHLPARMRIGGAWVDVSIRNLSARGLMAKSTADVAQRTYVELHRGTQIIVGRVVWSRDGHFGLRAQDHIDINGMMGRTQSANDAGPPCAATGWPERRAKPREMSAQAIAATAERNRMYGNYFQFIAIGAAALSGSVAAAAAVAGLLQRAFAPAVSALGG